MLDDIKIEPLVETIQYLEISDEEYFGPKFKNYVSNSRLALINPDQDGSPVIYRDGLSKHSKYSGSLVFGSATHELILQPESFYLVEEVDRPTAKLGFMADELFETFWVGNYIADEEVIRASDKIDYYKGKMDAVKIKNVLSKCRAYWEGRLNHEKEGRVGTPIYLDYASRNKLKQCLHSVSSNKKIQKLLHPKGLFEEVISKNEGVLVMDVRMTVPGAEPIVLKLKAKLDNFTIDADSGELVLNDLKTTGHYLTQFVESFEKYHYNRQMAMYLWMLQLYVKNVLKVELSSMKTHMLLVSTVPDFRAGVFVVTKEEINKGFNEFKRLLRMVAYHEVYGYDGSVGK